MPRALLLLLCALALTAPAAAAQDDEIFVDPGSPSGKEYALPVESARSAAAKGSGKTASDAKQAAPLFGEGVRSGAKAGSGASGSSRSADSGSGGSGASGASGRSGDAGSGSPSQAVPPAPATVRAQAAAPDGGSAVVAILGVGAGVLLAGGLIGLALRRRASR